MQNSMWRLTKKACFSTLKIYAVNSALFSLIWICGQFQLQRLEFLLFFRISNVECFVCDQKSGSVTKWDSFLGHQCQYNGFALDRSRFLGQFDGGQYQTRRLDLRRFIEVRGEPQKYHLSERFAYEDHHFREDFFIRYSSKFPFLNFSAPSALFSSIFQVSTLSSAVVTKIVYKSANNFEKCPKLLVYLKIID